MTEKRSGSEHKKPSVKAALAIIETSELRLTRPRRALLDAIFAAKGPFSAPSLVKFFGKASAKSVVDPVTIYRTLPVFEELGILERCDFSDDMAYYEVAAHLGCDHGKSHHHHHLVCNSCKKVEKLDFCILESQEQLLGKLGYTSLKHRLEFSGLCPKCSR